MSALWYAILGLLFMAYFALGGLDQGVGAAPAAAQAVTAPAGRAQRRRAAVPRQRGLDRRRRRRPHRRVPAPGGGAVRRRVPGDDRRRARPHRPQRRRATAQPRHAGAGGFDALIAAGALALAVGWGLLLGVVTHGVPMTADGHVHGFAPLGRLPPCWLTALVNVVLVVAERRRATWPGAPPTRACGPRRSRQAGPAGAALVLVAAAVWYTQDPPGVSNPIVATALVVATAAALVADPVRHRRAGVRRHAVACALPVITVALAGIRAC